MIRISRDEMFMRIAETLSERATCPRAKVGAVLVRNHRIISTGYNGSPSGHPHCGDDECEIDESGSCIRTIHAEANVIAFAALVGVATRGSTLYTTMAPCYNCAKLLINAGVAEVIYAIEYKDERGLNLLRETRIIARLCVRESL